MGETARARTRRRDDERFARAVDSGVGAAEFGTELAVVAALRRLGGSVTVEPGTRERIARRITETRPRRRVLPVLTTAVVALTALVCLGLLLARDALPGEPLYHLKRAHETAMLGLTFDTEDDAARRLSYASRKLEEITILGRHGVHDPDTYRLALADFTEHATRGAAELMAFATRTDGRPLTTLSAWAQRKSAEVAEVEPLLPTTVSTDVTALLERIERRSTALSERMNCYEITSVHSDDLGALPATSACTPPESRPSSPARTAPRAEPETSPEAAPATFVEHPHDVEATTEPTPRSADVVPAVPHTPTSREGRPPTSEPEAPAVVSVPPLPSGSPAVTAG